MFDQEKVPAAPVGEGEYACHYGQEGRPDRPSVGVEVRREPFQVAKELFHPVLLVIAGGRERGLIGPFYYTGCAPSGQSQLIFGLAGGESLRGLSPNMRSYVDIL